MALSDDALKAKARRAYERSRFQRALRFAVYPIPLMLISHSLCGTPGSSIAAGALLMIAAVAFAWRGEDYEAAVGPGIMSGLGAFTVPFVGESLGICAGNVTACAALCFVGGAITGAFLGTRALREGLDRRQFLSAGCTIAVLVGALGCVLAGLGGVLGMLAGVTTTSVPLLLLRRT